VAAADYGAPPHLVAAHAAWFDWERIADVERTSLPEFFDGRSHAKTPEVCLAASPRDFLHAICQHIGSCLQTALW